MTVYPAHSSACHVSLILTNSYIQKEKTQQEGSVVSSPAEAPNPSPDGAYRRQNLGARDDAVG